jgi:hypothetical protein
MVTGMCSCCGYLGECARFIGFRTILICVDCGQRAARAQQEAAWPLDKANCQVILDGSEQPARIPPVREMRQAKTRKASA